MSNTPIQDILDLADELASLAIKLRCDLESSSEFFAPQEASDTLESILEASQKITLPENFAHIKQFVREVEEETLELNATRDFGMQTNAG